MAPRQQPFATAAEQNARLGVRGADQRREDAAQAGQIYEQQHTGGKNLERIDKWNRRFADDGGIVVKGNFSAVGEQHLQHPDRQGARQMPRATRMPPISVAMTLSSCLGISPPHKRQPDHQHRQQDGQRCTHGCWVFLVCVSMRVR